MDLSSHRFASGGVAAEPHWRLSYCADPDAAALADRHYSRQTIGSRQFMSGGRKVVLVTAGHTSVWGALWPYPRYVRRTAFRDAWNCTIFRREPGCPVKASDLILEALAATRSQFGEPTADGFITYIDERKIRGPNPGYCFKLAGFRTVRDASHPSGRMHSKDRDLLLLHLPPERMPVAALPIGAHYRLGVDAA